MEIAKLFALHTNSKDLCNVYSGKLIWQISAKLNLAFIPYNLKVVSKKGLYGILRCASFSLYPFLHIKKGINNMPSTIVQDFSKLVVCAGSNFSQLYVCEIYLFLKSLSFGYD